MKHVQIHRFRDKVAIHVGNGETVYLTAGEAWDIGEKLKECSTDVETTEFVHSPFSTFSATVKGEM
jgi:hypothetical protein